MYNKTKKNSVSLKSLYSETDILMFYINSSNKFFPGEGHGEIIKESHKPNYNELSKIDNWRQKLSNQWISPFKLNGLNWQSVEHYYQGSKFKINSHAYYLQFSLDSGSELSKDPILAHSAGSISGYNKKIKLRDSSIKIDPDFFNERSQLELFRAQYCKFKQNKEMRNILLKTNNAKLLQYRVKKSPVFLKSLIYIRYLLNK
jgi:predicted NAD-dependent protein-ADP-ribosyltransferase YbiA (DUF1768 family)